jgi:hypothetical protein
MFHKNVSNPNSFSTSTSTGLRLVTSLPPAKASATTSLLDLIFIASRRCSAFFAEAAVLVLVFGILDFCLLKGRIELHWIIGALAISVGLLAASIAMDFAAHRWTKAHP